MNSVLSMRSVSTAAALSLAIVTAGCGQPSSRQGATELAGEVTARWTKAFDSGDPAALAALYADDARSMAPGATLDGRADIESYWRADIGDGGAATELAVTDAIMEGDVLHLQGTYRVTGENDTELTQGQFQQMWTQAGGDWSLRREMWRMDPALVHSIDVARRLTSSWTEAYNAGDAGALSALYAQDAVLSTVQDGSFTGPMAIELFWVRDFGGTKPSSTLTLTDVYVSGELAHLEGEYEVSDRGTVTHGHYVQLWMREGSAWRVHREMWLR